MTFSFDSELCHADLDILWGRPREFEAFVRSFGGVGLFAGPRDFARRSAFSDQRYIIDFLFGFDHIHGEKKIEHSKSRQVFSKMVEAICGQPPGLSKLEARRPARHRGLSASNKLPGGRNSIHILNHYQASELMVANHETQAMGWVWDHGEHPGNHQCSAQIHQIVRYRYCEPLHHLGCARMSWWS
jgi:hypothetical protein